MAKSKNKYFVVWVGQNPGIYNSWEACKKQVHGYPEAKYKGFATESEAKTALESSYWNYVGKHAKVNVPNKELIEKYESLLHLSTNCNKRMHYYTLLQSLENKQVNDIVKELIDLED